MIFGRYGRPLSKSQSLPLGTKGRRPNCRGVLCSGHILVPQRLYLREVIPIWLVGRPYGKPRIARERDQLAFINRLGDQAARRPS
jgi:hypothetical protein